MNTEVIFNRTLGIIGLGEFDLHNLFSQELAPISTSLFLDDGTMRPASSKSKQKAFLQVEQSSRNKLQRPNLLVLGGCAIPWTIHWPISGTIKDLANVIDAYIQVRLTAYPIFDRYFDYSPQRCTHVLRTTAAGSRHHLTL